MFSFTKKKQKLNSLSNEALFQLYKETESKESFGEIYKRYVTIVYGACLKYMKDKALAKDATMEVFEMLMTKIPEQENIHSINNWIYFVTRNKCITKLRDAKKMPTEELNSNFFEKNTDFHMENEGFLSLYNEGNPGQGENLVLDAIEKLNTEQKACIKAFYLNNKSYKQIEQQLGYPLARVKSHIQNGKRNLKVLLQETQIRT